MSEVVGTLGQERRPVPRFVVAPQDPLEPLDV